LVKWFRFLSNADQFSAIAVTAADKNHRYQAYQQKLFHLIFYSLKNLLFTYQKKRPKLNIFFFFPTKIFTTFSTFAIYL